MGEITKEALLRMRDLITEMEPNLDFNDNTILCCNRLSNIMISLAFNDYTVVVAGDILNLNSDEEYEKRMKELKLKGIKSGLFNDE